MMVLWRPFTRAAKTTGPPKCAMPIKGKVVKKGKLKKRAKAKSIEGHKD